MAAACTCIGSGALAQNAGQDQTAQSNPSTGADVLQEVVVTAQFRSQSVQQIPIAITAVNAQMLEQRSQNSIVDVANQAPNVTLKQSGVAFGPSLTASIRGIGQYDFDPALEPGVGIYVDDVYYGSLTGSVLDLLDLDRVEILRGPQGTLAGKNSIGGAVKLYSQKPNADEGSKVEILYGSRNHIEARGSADFVVAPDSLFVRISGVANHQDGYVDVQDYACTHPGSAVPQTFLTHAGGCLLGQEGGKAYAAARLAVRWLINDSLEANFVGDFTHDTSQNAATTLLYANNPAITLNGVPYDSRFVPTNPYTSYSTYSMPAAGGEPAFFGRDSVDFVGWGGSGTLDWKLSDNLSLKSITALRAFTSSWYEDNDASPEPVGLGGEYLAHHQFSEELRLNGSAGRLLDYTFGGYYFRELTVYGTHQDLWYVLGGPGFDFVGNDPVLAHTKAGFLHTVWHLSDKLNFTAGVRYTKEDKDYSYVRLNPDGSTGNPFVGSLNGQTGSFKGSRTDYRADVDYRWTDNVMTYAQISTGFKGGGVNPRPFFPFQVEPFAAETLTNYELGLKSSMFDHKLRLNLAAFYANYSNIQLTLLNCDFLNPPGFPPGLPCALPANAGNAHIKGVEAETEIHPVGGLEIDASGSWLGFDYTSINANAGGPSQPAGVQLGMVTPFTPKWKASGGIQYAIPVGAWGSITPRFDASYQDEIFTNAVNGPRNRVGGYTLMNGRVTWRSMSDKWQAAVEILNLGNKLYYLNVFDLSGLGAGSTTGQPGPKREFALSVKHTM